MGYGNGLLLHQVGNCGSSVNRNPKSAISGSCSQNFSEKHRLTRTTGPISRKLLAFCFSGSAGENTTLFDLSTPSGSATMAWAAPYSARKVRTTTSFFRQETSFTTQF